MQEKESLPKKFSRAVSVRLSEYRYLAKPFIIIFIIYCIALVPIVRANFNYIDDLGRAVYGYSDFEYFSRFSASYLSKLIHTDTHLYDISPLTQIIAALIISLASVITLHAFAREKKISPISIIGVLPLGLSPYFLECFSYKYDSPYMALSVLSSVFPLLFINEKKRIYCPVCAVCTLITCVSYQSATGIFPMAAVFICFRIWDGGEGKKALRLLLCSAASYISGMLIFRFFIMNPIDESLYVNGKLLPFTKLIPGFFRQLFEYYKTVWRDFRISWALLCLVALLFFAVSGVIESKRKLFVSLPVSALTLVLAVSLAFGVYPALATPLYAPRAMYGFGALIAFAAVNICRVRKEILGKAVCVLISWCFFVFSFTYGNALSYQKQYTDFRISMVIDDLNENGIISREETKKIQIQGSVGKAAPIRNMPHDLGIIDRLIPETFAGGWYWSEYYFYNYFAIPNLSPDSSVDFTALGLPIITDTAYHTIYGDGEYILIVLK